MRCYVLLLTALLFSRVGAPQTKSVSSPDKQAYLATLKITDPQQRLDALRSFLAKYPKSKRADEAQDDIFSLLVKNYPLRTDEINRQAQVMIKATSRRYRYYEKLEIASDLADARVGLPLAEKLALGVQKGPDQNGFMASMRKAYKKYKTPVPSDPVLVTMFKADRAGRSSILGYVYFQEGNVNAALPLLENAISDDPNNAKASAARGMIAAKRDHTQEALSFLTRARLCGKLTPDQQTELDTLYKQTAPSEPFETYLDAQYKKLFPLPFEAASYQPQAKPSGRVVLLELFTGSGCPPCAGADLAMDGDLERYTRDQFVLLDFEQHIPRPDPLANPSTVERFSFYGLQGTPTSVIDGKVEPFWGGGRDRAQFVFDHENKVVDSDLRTPPEAAVQISAKGSSAEIRVHASASDIKSAAKTLKLGIALVENQTSYSGENGIRFHYMVVRSMIPDNGFAVTSGKPTSFDYTFDIPKINAGLKNYLDDYERSNDRFGPITFIQKTDTLNPKNLSVVAFVQDTTTKHILQTAYAPVSFNP